MKNAALVFSAAFFAAAASAAAPPATTPAPAAAPSAPVVDTKPRLTVSFVEASTHPDTRWFNEKAYLFRAGGITQQNLTGHTLTWTLDVKRKLAPWKTATSWLLTTQKVGKEAELPQVTFGLIYRSLAKKKFQPGEHVAAFVAKDEKGNEIFRSEVGFLLPAVGPNAYNPRDYAK